MPGLREEENRSRPACIFPVNIWQEIEDLSYLSCYPKATWISIPSPSSATNIRNRFRHASTTTVIIKVIYWSKLHTSLLHERLLDASRICPTSYMSGVDCPLALNNKRDERANNGCSDADDLDLSLPDAARRMLIYESTGRQRHSVKHS